MVKIKRQAHLHLVRLRQVVEDLVVVAEVHHHQSQAVLQAHPHSPVAAGHHRHHQVVAELQVFPTTLQKVLPLVLLVTTQQRKDRPHQG